MGVSRPDERKTRQIDELVDDHVGCVGQWTGLCEEILFSQIIG